MQMVRNWGSCPEGRPCAWRRKSNRTWLKSHRLPPPVCKLMDFGKYKYEQSKREKEAKKKQKVISVKEVKLRPNIEDHDFEVKARNASRFLKDGDKVKATIIFRGREIVHTQIGQQLLKRLAEDVKDISTIERQPKLEGKNMIMILAPKQDN